MRAAVLAAAVFGAAAGAAAGWIAASARAPDVAVPHETSRPAVTSDDGADTRALSGRMERLERSNEALAQALDRLTARLSERDESEGTSTAIEAPARPGRAAPPPAPGPPRVSRASEFDQLTTDDLEMEADERHMSQTDHAGGVQRYRALIARGGTSAQIRRWSLRLGDCLELLGRSDAAADAYRVAYEASSEDTSERMLVIRALTEHAFRKGDHAEALAWNDIALKSKFVDFKSQCYAADIAKAAGLKDRERAAIVFLIETYPDHQWFDAWKTWLAGLDAK